MTLKKTALAICCLVLLASGGVILPFADCSAAAKKTAVTIKKSPIKKTPVITAAKLPGRIVLEQDSYNKLWYVSLKDKKRYYIHNDEDLQLVVSKFSLKPTAKEFAKISTSAKAKTNSVIAAKYRGNFLISPANGKTYYLNPGDDLAYLVESYADFYHDVALVIGLKIPDTLLRQITLNGDQLIYDPTFSGTPYVMFDGVTTTNGYLSNQVTPLASLSKVMTALVFLDTDPDWDKTVTITPAEIAYPCTLQTCGTTSEIPLKAGDTVKIADLWVAMLAASSNQSAKILADSTGMTQAEFVAKMNEKAKSLGLKKTRFVEMTGLSADNISTAAEFAVIAKTAFDKLVVSDATAQTDYLFYAAQPDGTNRLVKVANRNTSLLAMNIDASKTGFLVEAQRNAAVAKNGQIIVVLHAYSLPQRNSIVKSLMDKNILAAAN